MCLDSIAVPKMLPFLVFFPTTIWSGDIQISDSPIDHGEPNDVNISIPKQFCEKCLVYNNLPHVTILNSAAKKHNPRGLYMKHYSRRLIVILYE